MERSDLTTTIPAKKTGAIEVKMSSPEELKSTLGDSIFKGLTGVVQAIDLGARTKDEVVVFCKMAARDEYERTPERFLHYIDGCWSIALAMAMIEETATPGNFKTVESAPKPMTVN
jgi:hypothetical protein